MNAPSNADSAQELLIRDLATDLMPVRRLWPPSVRTFSWLVIGATTAVILAMIADLSALGHRLAAAPDLWLQGTCSGINAIPTAFFAFQLSPPESSPPLALPPPPAALVWILCSCLRLPR